MPPEQKTSGQVRQKNEQLLESDEAPVHAETGPRLRLSFVDGKNPSVKNIEVQNIGKGVSDPAGPSA